MLRSNPVLLTAALLVGCALEPAATEKGAESPLAIEGAADSIQHPTEHGELRFGIPAAADLERRAQFHGWTFTLTAQAALTIQTQPASPGAPEVDTVLYLYREGPRGWGSWIARNDDASGLWSAISRTLEAGRYRIVVKGYSARTYGPFGVIAQCQGEGCGVVRAAECAFGGTFREIPATNRFNMGRIAQLDASSPLTAMDEQQIVRALHASSHTDVTTAAEAFARVDSGIIDRYRIVDIAGARAFEAFEYGAGDNSYGAIFFEGTAVVASEIHDGDLTECVALEQACVFGVHFNDWTEDHRKEPLLDTFYTLASTREALTDQQILIAAAVGDSTPPATIAEAFAAFDEGTVHRQELRDSVRDRSYTVISYVRGDHRFGAMFELGTANVVGEIFDNEHQRCAAFDTASVGEACRTDGDCETGSCLTTEDGPWCWRTYCTAPCTRDEDCVAWAAAAGADERGPRCETTSGECWLEGVGAQACE